MSENHVLLLSLLEEVLGRFKLTRKENEAAFFCPAHPSDKKKLQVNLTTGYWHCWVCQVENRMSGKSLFSLFKRVHASPDQFSRLSEILGESRPSYDEKEETVEVKVLPKEFISLTQVSKSPNYRHAIHYLHMRGVTYEDVLKYNIGYAEYGKYGDKIIVPSYDANGRLNFFACRAFRSDDPFTHQMPMWSKDIIGFESFINWKMPIVIVEGVYDAMAIRVNAIPLFGKTIGDTLLTAIMKNNAMDIYVCLDRDAIRNSIRYMERFIGEGRRVFFVDLPGKDPSKLGFKKMQEILSTTKRVTMGDLLLLRMRNL